VHKYMVLALIASALTFSASLYGQDQGADLRAAAGCGPAKTQFNVKTDKTQHPLAQPESGKALVYVFSEYISDPQYQVVGHVTMRVGMDGNWMGASHQSSFLSFGVDPGAHRLCSDVQSIFAPKNLNAATTLTAEPNKTYYYRAALVDNYGGPIHMILYPLNEADGLLMLSSSALSTSQPKK
jgi:hypothetical protein